MRYFEGPLNIIDHTPSKEYTIVATTFRLTEHYLSGPMSRFNSWLNELRDRARQRVRQLHERGNEQAYLYGCDSVGDYGPLHSFFLLEDHPNEYNLPEDPPQPFKGQGRRYAASLLAGVALTAISAWFFNKGQ